jgi:hypothetical protein
MGVDLKVCPIQYDGIDWWLLNNGLETDRDYDFQEAVNALSVAEVPARYRVTKYDDDGLKDVTETPYGDPIMFVRASEFRRLQYEPVSEWNRAVLAFLRAAPPETPIVLWWH